MLSTVAPDQKENRILAALPAQDYARLVDDLELVALSPGQILYRPGDRIRYVYFPATCLVALIFTTEDGASAELAMTGHEGLIGFPLVLGGGETTTHGAVAQSEGHAYRLRAEMFAWEFDQAGALQCLCLAYIQALMTQMAQSVVCNRYHSIDQQLCRWLLICLDQQPGNKLHFTHEQIAGMLGVRREGVTEAARKLQASKLIHYHRGHIAVLDRPGLETRSCECYQVVKSEYSRLFEIIPLVLPKHRARPNPANLRLRAETQLQREAATRPDTSWDTQHLLHELQVHQIELELQVEELRQAYDEADALRRKYADVYDFAPVAYFTLDQSGVITQLNLAAAILIGVVRSEGARHRFSAFVKPEFLPAFNRFYDEVTGGKYHKECELVLMATDHRPETAVEIEAVVDENGEEFRMVVMETGTAKKKAFRSRTRPIKPRSISPG